MSLATSTACTVLLQQQSLDIVHGIEVVQDLKEQLKELCIEVDDWHSIWFELAVDIAEEVGTKKPSLPCRCNRQTQWTNVEADLPKVYYRRSLTIPLLNHFIKELEDRFSSNAKIITCLVPSVMSKRDDCMANKCEGLCLTLPG